LVDPPVAATAAIAFSSDSRVTICDGRTPRFKTSITRVPARSATEFFVASTAGTSPLPIGASPRNSHAVAIVFAVN
jgi:hypothetical protein